MKILISGVCGFVGSHIARYLIESHQDITVVGIDNLARFGSETNRPALKNLGVNRCRQAQNSGVGDPLSLHMPLSLARKAS
jgi:nucleoside-diphosphate-sugar epimerase